MSYPACFNSQREYDHWSRLARTTKVDSRHPCIDCTVAYQQRMTAAGRCAYPDAILEDSEPCLVPFAAVKPEASSGKTPTPVNRQRKAGKKTGRKHSRSVPTVVNASSPHSGKSGKTGAAGAKSRKRRSP